jgi:carboxypeptidase C (cathepsin A)
LYFHAAEYLDRVEQPIGTGYTVGKPTAKSEEDIARDFVGFFKNFQQTFGIKNFKIYVTGNFLLEFGTNIY